MARAKLWQLPVSIRRSGISHQRGQKSDDRYNLSYFINFYTFLGYYYDCQPGIVYDLRWITVYGYLFKSYVNPANSYKSNEENLYYLNVIGNGSRITEVPASGKINIPNEGFDPRIPPTVISQASTYLGESYFYRGCVMMVD